VTFKKNICSGCVNYEERKRINWKQRYSELQKLCDQYRSHSGMYDIIVPVGGGKDSSYVAWVLKNKLRMKPLCVFVEPPLMTKIGKKNLDNFEKKGFKVLRIKHTNLNRDLNGHYFKKFGLPQHTWLASIKIAPLKIAKKYNIKLVMFGEEGESMYGGVNKNRNQMEFDKKNIGKYYLEMKYINFSKKQKKYFNLDKKDIKDLKDIKMLYWSYFEKWDEYFHLKIARKYCGLKNTNFREKNAINKHSHTDQKMFALHMYLAYLKYGFSRATSDTSIEIRHNRITREKAINITKKFDHIFPSNYIKNYCKYFKINQKSFFEILDNHKNKKLFH
jgi:N-acetyl sugar amidotransferase